MSDASEQPKLSFGNIYASVRGRIELGDALFYLYLLVFVRQYFWIVANNKLAWALSVPLAALFWYLYISTKQFAAERFGRQFWLLVGLPLLALYMLRVPFPDHSFDVLSYHLLHSERSLHSTLFAPGDFFPTSSPYNPATDTLTGISRLILGFRLGTIINLFALVWAAQVADKILRLFTGRAWLRSALVLLIVLAEQLLFEVNNYMVDLLAVPILLEATLLALRADEAKSQRTNFVHIALLTGASAALKLTNLAVVLPVIAVCTYKALTGPRRLVPKELAKTALSALAAFLAPLLPFCIYIYSLTGNPVFPVANVLFKSPYWPTHGGWDNRWGPQSLLEMIVWPVQVLFVPERYSELAVYSGRLSIGFVAALGGIFLMRRNERARTLCFLLLASSLLWSVSGMGYSRYGLYQEMLAGMTVAVIASILFKTSDGARYSWQSVIALIFCATLVVQAALACKYVLRNEWGGRPTLLTNPRGYFKESRLMLRDHSLRSFLPDEERTRFDNVPVWLETCVKTSGFETLLNRHAPVIAVRQPEYFFTRESRRQFIRAVLEPGRPNMFSLCLNEDLPSAKQLLASRSLEIGSMTPVEVPFFSPRDRVSMTLIEVLTPQAPEARSKFESFWMNAAFPDSDYREEITALDAPSAMRAGEKVSIRFKVKNLGLSTWPALGNKDGRYQVNIGNRWLDAAGKIEINGADGRTAMKADLSPDGEVEIPLVVKAPSEPGEYVLEIDMIHEGVTWFYERGASPLHLRVRVEH